MKQYTFTEPAGGDVNQGWALLSVCWAFVACALVSTILRVWVRAHLTRNLGSDDWNMMAAMATTIIGAAFVTTEVLHGLGRHEFYLTPSQRRIFQVIGWADWIQTFITLALTKISICLFLLRIVDTRQVRMGIYGLIIFITIFTTICIAIFLGVCRPLKAYWDIGVQGKCLSDRSIAETAIAHGVLSALTDLICAAFPILFLRRLRIPLQTKVGLCALMGLGVITAACCLVRTVLSGSITDKDLTWSISSNVAWRLPEVNIGIVCANAPVLRSLYLFFTGRLESSKAPPAASYYGATSSSGVSKPSNVTWGGSTKVGNNVRVVGGKFGSGETDVDPGLEIEMGLGGREEEGKGWETDRVW